MAYRKYLEETNDSLSKIEFGKLIASPISACIDAQASACIATSRYVKEFGFEKNNDNDILDAKSVKFYFNTPDGKAKRLTVPLISLVPLPYLQIKDVDLSFKTQVSINSNGKIVAKMTSGGSSENAEEKNSFQSDMRVNVGIKASSSDIPLGISRVLEILGNNITAVKSEDKPAATVDKTEKKADVIVYSVHDPELPQEENAAENKNNADGQNNVENRNDVIK